MRVHLLLWNLFRYVFANLRNKNKIKIKRLKKHFYSSQLWMFYLIRKNKKRVWRSAYFKRFCWKLTTKIAINCWLGRWANAEQKLDSTENDRFWISFIKYVILNLMDEVKFERERELKEWQWLSKNMRQYRLGKKIFN